jgi:hypothetical protein
VGRHPARPHALIVGRDYLSPCTKRSACPIRLTGAFMTPETEAVQALPCVPRARSWRDKITSKSDIGR